MGTERDVPMLMKGPVFFIPTNETRIGRGDCYAFEMLITLRSEITVRSHGNRRIPQRRKGVLEVGSEELRMYFVVRVW